MRKIGSSQIRGGIITLTFIYIILGLLIFSIPLGVSTGRTYVVTDITHISSSQSTKGITRGIDEAQEESVLMPELVNDEYRSTSSQYTYKGIRPDVSVADDLWRSSQSTDFPKVSTSEYTYDVDYFGHIPHDPIVIDGNAEFAAGGFPGDGSPTTPYRIENYNISSGGISIRNTDVYFIIDNCTLHSGLTFSGVVNGQVVETLFNGGSTLNYTSDCTFYDCTFESHVWMEVGPLNGLTFDYCTFFSYSGIATYSIAIDYFEITNCDFYGEGEVLYLPGGSHLTIDHCNFVNHLRAMWVGNFEQSSITNCNFTDGYWGCTLGGSGITVAHNLFEDNGEGVTGQPYALGIYGDNFHVYDNTFDNNSLGIGTGNLLDSVIEYNTFTESLEYGIEISEGDSSITVAHNTLTDNTYGMWLEDSTMENTIWNNTCNNNILDGIFIDGGSNYMILNNTCMNNGRHGIVLYNDALDNTIERNIVSGNIVGILLESIWTPYPQYFDEKNTIIDNDCYDNEYGICMLDAVCTIVTENDCTLNQWDGITITGTSDTNIINNNFCDNNVVDGIYVNSTSGNLIDHNFCSNSLWGIFLNRTPESIVSNNTCEYNDIGIYLLSDHELTTYHELIRNICTHNSVAGIYLYDSEYNDLEHNICTFNNHGIYIFASSRFNDLLNNTCNENTGAGIFIDASTWNDLMESNCSQNVVGIHLLNADSSVIESSYCGGNTVSGIHLESTDYTNLIGNMLKDTGVGIVLQGGHCELSDNTCIENSVGIDMSSSSLNTLTNNICNDNTQHGININTCSVNTFEQMECTGNGASGIRIIGSSNNEFYYCELSLNQYGFYFNSGDFNSFGNSSIYDNTVRGIWIESSLNTSIVWNSIDGNTQSALDDSINNTFDYNYWSDYAGVDANSDGYGDTPHNIPGTASNTDPHPLWYSPVAPEWVIEPTDQTIEYPADLTYDLDVTAAAPIRDWWLSDTTHFSIDSSGVVTNTVPLDLGTNGGARVYPIEASVDNIYGVTTTASFNVIVDDTITPTITSPDDLSFGFGATAPSISWNVSDASLSEYDIIIISGGYFYVTIYGNLNTTEATITLNLDEDLDQDLYLMHGEDTVYNVTIFVQDRCYNSVTDTVLVTLTRAGGPLLDISWLFVGAAVTVVGILAVVFVLGIRYGRRRGNP